MQVEPTVTDRIAARLDDLSPQLRRAAEFVAKHPEDVATRSQRYLAGMMELAPPTFSRLAAALGYDGYEDLRESCRHEIKMRRLRFSERAEALQKCDAELPEGGRFIFRQGTAGIDNITEILNSVDLDLLELAAARLIAARRVVLVGSMSSRPFVDYMAYMASMAFDNWQVFGSDTGSTAATLVDVDDRDAAVVVCKAPFAQRSVDATKHLGDLGVWVIGMTDEVLSPLHPLCAATFVVSTETPQFFSSHVATLVLIESLIGMVIARGGAHVRRRIKAVESTSHRIGDYFRRAGM